MKSFPTKTTVFTLVIALLLTGCQKLQDLAAGPGEVANLRAIEQELSIEVSQLRAKILVLEELQRKQNANFDERLKIVETTGKKNAQPATSSTLSADTVVALKIAISNCVNQVHATNEAKAEASGKTYWNFWTGFDAFYNPATGRVQNNNMYNGGRPAAFFFDKCMTSLGFPLG